MSTSFRTKKFDSNKAWGGYTREDLEARLHQLEPGEKEAFLALSATAHGKPKQLEMGLNQQDKRLVVVGLPLRLSTQAIDDCIAHLYYLAHQGYSIRIPIESQSNLCIQLGKSSVDESTVTRRHTHQRYALAAHLKNTNLHQYLEERLDLFVNEQRQLNGVQRWLDASQTVQEKHQEKQHSGLLRGWDHDDLDQEGLQTTWWNYQQQNPRGIKKSSLESLTSEDHRPLAIRAHEDMTQQQTLYNNTPLDKIKKAILEQTFMKDGWHAYGCDAGRFGWRWWIKKSVTHPETGQRAYVPKAIKNILNWIDAAKTTASLAERETLLSKIATTLEQEAKGTCSWWTSRSLATQKMCQNYQTLFNQPPVEATPATRTPHNIEHSNFTLGDAPQARAQEAVAGSDNETKGENHQFEIPGLLFEPKAQAAEVTSPENDALSAGYPTPRQNTEDATGKTQKNPGLKKTEELPIEDRQLQEALAALAPVLG